MTLTAERIRELLDYDPQTGVFTWRGTGKIAGTKQPRGYVVVGIERKKHYAHRLAWAHVTGRWPDQQIDHINLDRSDNRFANLRPADHSQNGANQRRRKRTTAGLKGVYYHQKNDRWVAQLVVRGEHHYLGSYECPAAASLAYQVAADSHFGEYARA